MTQKTLPLPGTYTLDAERTVIRCDCKALMGLMTVHGTFTLNAGRITIAADPTASTIDVSIAAGSFASGLGVRDADVIGPTLLDAKTYPEILFASVDAGTGAGAIRPDGDGWVLTGSVTAHGTTQPAEVRIGDVTFEGGAARFHATAILDRFGFGITSKKRRVGRTVTLTIDATAVPA